MSFSLDATLDAREPLLIEFLGAPSGVTHSITGTLQLHVEKPVQLRQLSVAFIGQVYSTFGKAALSVKSEPINTEKIEQSMLDAPTQFRPGDYSFPFQLRLPGDIATTDSSKLVSTNLFWEYFLVASATPVGLVARRKEQRQRLQVRRVHIAPSSSTLIRFSAGRKDQVDCSIYGPRFLGLGQDKIFLSMYLHAYSSMYRIKEVQVQANQNEWIELTTTTHGHDKRGQRFVAQNDDRFMSVGNRRQLNNSIVNIFNTKPISHLTIIPNPDQEHFTTGWGRESPIEFDLNLLPSTVLPSEFFTWLKIGHVFTFTVVFADEAVKPLVVKAPFIVGKILEDPWSHHALRSVTGVDRGSDATALPGYGEEMEDSTLLDSNTQHMDYSSLYRELYPERSELTVPDVSYDLPPMYQVGEDSLGQWSEKT